MDPEQMHFSPALSTSGEIDSQDSGMLEPAPHAGPDHEEQRAEQTQNEPGSATKRRRRRSTRSTRAGTADTPEQAAEAAEHAEQAPEPVEQREAPRQPLEELPEPAPVAPGGPSVDWNPFLFQPAESHQEPAPAPEPVEQPTDFAPFSFASPHTGPNVGEREAAAPPAPAQEAQSETPAPSITPDSPDTASYEPMRAPLSGVEVRPPRRYRFDRPAPTSSDTRQPAAPPQPATPPAPEPVEPPPPATFDTPSSAEQDIEATIERAMTETPEVEADIAAAEELALATQAALEEEVVETLESLAQRTKQGGQTSGSRRRRRRRSSAQPAAAEAAPEKVAAPQPPPQPAPPSAPQPFAPPPGLPATSYNQPYLAQPYQITNGLQQIGQPQSPFGGPEPSSARGFGPVPRGVASPAERSVRMPRPERTVETNNISASQLATIFTQAIQQQTDRLLMELRRNQGTPSMTVNFPPMPSNERIGVFVDVANLLYSARNMRIAIDFGRLLDFLRGNRRLVRAHAYCPTSPDPRAEQMFLDAVKGLGYRITTKNYKTFSSGAKKADLDLDLCMDIVRLVDAGAVDCISLVSGDSDFLPLLEYCSDHGVRVEVAAFDESTASILRQSCDLFINLSMVEEIRA